MKFKHLLAAALLFCTAGAWAQTDVTSTYLTNADFSQGTPIGSNLKGYGKDGTPYGFQSVDGWTSVVTNGDNSTAAYPNSGMGSAVFAYGSSYQLQGNNKAAPATNPNGEASGNCLGFFAVWGCGGYYYQDVTFPAGKYIITVPMYSQSGTQANTTYTGFFPTSGTNRTVAVNPTVGQWVTQTVTFTLTAETAGQIRVGYQSTGSGSGANPHLFIDCVKIEYTAVVVKDVLQNAITAATAANNVLNDANLAQAITNATTVLNDSSATQDQINAAAATLNAAVEVAMDSKDVTGLFLTNPGFESCTVSTDNAAAGGSAAPRDIAGGWTQNASAAWSSSAVVEYGGAGQVNGVSAPSADNLGNGGYTLGVSVGWGGTVTYKTDAVTLPAGVYNVTVNGYNALSGVTQFKSMFGFVPTSGTATMSTKMSFTYDTWEADQITFTLNEATEGYFQVGGQAISGGSGSNAKVFFDNITIGYKSFLAGAKEAYDNAVANAETAKTENPNVTGDELTALNAELAKTEPTTIEGYNTAAEAINNAKDALVAAAPSYNAFVTAKSSATPDLAYAADAKKTALNNAKAVANPANKTDADTKTADIITALRAYYESHAMAENVNGAVDMTDKVAAANADTNTGWTGGIGTNQGQGYTDATGNVAPKYLDGGWAQNTGVNIDMTRSVEIPAGKYLLTVTARGAASLDEYTLSIGGKTVDLSHNGGEGGVFGNGWDDVSVEFETDGSTQTLEVKATSTASQQWISINRFRLVRLELYTEMAKEADYQAMEAALATAEAMTLGFDENEYAPYNNVEAIQAITTAKAVDKNVENAKADIEAITAALGNWTANTTEVDAIFDGQFATTAANTTSGDINLPGWTKVQGIRLLVKDEATDPGLAYTDGKAAVFSWGGTTLTYGEQDGYTLPLNKHEMYKLTFKASAWRDGAWPSWVSVELDGVKQEGSTDVPGKINDAEGNPFRTYTYYLEPTADNSILKIYMNQHFTLADLSLKLAVAEAVTISETSDPLATMLLWLNSARTALMLMPSPLTST